MFIKFYLSALLPKSVRANPRLEKTKKSVFCLLVACWSPLASCLVMLPATGAEQGVLGVVKSEENANEWTGITTRLQAANVAYCVIDLPSVKNAADLGDRRVLFLPNVESLTPEQAIALEDWMSQGGRLIASGPVGNLSQPGVRQLLRSLLGAYWGFSLSTPSNLQPLKTRTQQWVRQTGLGGTVHGGAIIPTGIASQTAAIWQSKDSPPAVVTTDQSTVLGWRWGVDAAAPVELDSAWLRAALSRYIQPSGTQATKTEVSSGTPKNCNGTVAPIASVPKPQPATTARPQPQPKRANPASGLRNAFAPPKPLAIPKITPQQSQEPIERLAPPGLGVAPNSQPLTNLQASTLHQELENLIGRFESAQLAADAKNGKRNGQLSRDGTQIASNGSPVAELPTAAEAVAEAREIAKTLPQLVNQRNYTAARQQWLKAQQILWNHYPTDRTLAEPEIRAMWLDRGSIVRARSEQGLAIIFDQLAAAGINTVFFETVNAGYPIYPSQVAPQQNPLVRGWDPLAAAVKLAHKRGMELHAWVWAFAAGNRRHNALVNLPANYPGPLIATHPDWASYDNRGNLFPPGQGKPFLDPANPEVRRYLLSLFDEIVSRYKVDGLQLDYIRYPFQDPSADRTYGYGIAARQQFQQITGVDPTQIRPSDRALWQKWTEFRTYKIDSFVAEASQRLRQKRPNLIMSAAVFPLSEHDRIYKLQQHWEIWARHGDVDLIVPMTYAQDTYQFQRLAQPWLTSIELGSSLILPGIRLLNLPLFIAVDQIQLVRDLPVSGYSLFAVENLSNQLKAILLRTQGTGTSTLVPYRQPFQTATARYAALQREWNFLLANQQLRLREPALSAWRNQVSVVESALNQLATDPSSSRLATARASLTAFQSQFPLWMRSQAVQNPYQVKVWSNRLAILERLLNYGERVVLKREAPPLAEQP